MVVKGCGLVVDSPYSDLHMHTCHLEQHLLFQFGQQEKVSVGVVVCPPGVAWLPGLGVLAGSWTPSASPEISAIKLGAATGHQKVTTVTPCFIQLVTTSV